MTQHSAADAKAKLLPVRSTLHRNVLPPPAAGWRQRDMFSYEPINLAKVLTAGVRAAPS
jgi:hypothetical protein